jgi:hypothetical protein
MLQMKRNIVITLMLLFIFTAAYTQEWKKITAGTPPPGLANTAAILDEQHNRLVICGGASATGLTNKIWSLDLASQEWSEIPSRSSEMPKPRYTHNGLFDKGKNRMIIWSGQGDELYNDVWAFYFADSTWKEIFPDGNVMDAPLKRYGTVAVFDPKTRRLVNFAGFTTSGRFDDTWSLEVDSLKWTKSEVQVHPLKRCLHSAAVDEGQRKMYVFGGQSSGNLNDLWSLDLDAYTWSELKTEDGPSSRHFTSLIYANAHVLVFGGNGASQGNYSGVLNDLWKYSLHDQIWDSTPPGGALPAARAGHSAVYHKTNDQLILFGGRLKNGDYSDETWILNNVSSEILGTASPSSEPQFTIFPNPSGENTTIQLADAFNSHIVTLNLYSSLGILVKKMTYYEERNLSVNLSGLPQGTYLCVVTSGKHRAQKVLVKN